MRAPNPRAPLHRNDTEANVRVAVDAQLRSSLHNVLAMHPAREGLVLHFHFHAGSFHVGDSLGRLHEGARVLSQLDEYPKGTVDPCERIKNVMLIEMWERWRGYDKWVRTEAKIESSEIHETDIKNQYGQTMVKDYDAGDLITWLDARGEKHQSKFSVGEVSPLYQLVDGQTFTIRYDPEHPEHFYHPDLLRYRAKAAAWATLVLLGIIAFVAWFIWMSIRRSS